LIDVYGERADFGEDEKMEKTMMAFINPAPPPRIVVQGRRKRAFLIHEQTGMQKEVRQYNLFTERAWPATVAVE
jgi:hypothetical protein